MNIILDLKTDFEKILNHLKSEYAAIRTGRASIGLVENIIVECYGSKMPLNNLASISVPQPQTIFIQPWDKSIIKDIERAITVSGLGVNPIVDKDIIRVNIPSLTEERRKDLVKLVNKIEEEHKIRIRKIREDYMKKIDRMEENKEIREDEKFRLKEEVQEVVDEYNRQIEELTRKKEEEIMKI